MMNSNDGVGRVATVDFPTIDHTALWQRVTQEFACDHPDVILTKLTKSNATVEYRKQCRACGHNVAAVKKASLSMDQIRNGVPEFDKSIAERRRQEWQRRYEELKSEANEERIQEIEERSRERREWYQAYLRSPAWIRKRQLVLEREEGICQGCRRTEAAEVHHLTYDHIGDELLFELVALCSACHRRVHDKGE